MIANDHRSASISAGALGLALFLSLAPTAARADVTVGTVASSPDAASTLAPDQTVNVTLVAGGEPQNIATGATDVAALLGGRGIVVGHGDYVSAPLDAPLSDGMKVVYRRAVLVDIFVGKHKRTVRSSAPTVAALLAEQHIRVSSNDIVKPRLDVAPIQSDVVRVTRVETWTVHERQTIAPATRERDDSTLAYGTTRIEPGRPGLRESMIRFVRRDGSRPVRTVLASRIIREPQPRVVERGIAEYTSLAHVAEQGFNSALHFAGEALQMIATAYTASCDGCSGITATGEHAGFGVIAVDPSVIPLGTKLYIPGYGRAVAGDTGGAIHGHRVDLGMNTLSEALRFGRRPVTVYLLR